MATIQSISAIRSTKKFTILKKVAYSDRCVTEGAYFDGAEFFLHRVLGLIINHLLLHCSQLIDKLLAFAFLIHDRHIQIHDDSAVILQFHLLVLQLLPHFNDLVLTFILAVFD